MTGRFPSKKILKRRGTIRFDNTTTVFIDLVGFSRDATTNEMKRLCDNLGSTLDRVLRPNYYWDEWDKPNDLILSPSGDGYAITFCPAIGGTEILSQVRSIYYDLVRLRHYQVRFGLNVGPIFLFLDLNNVINVIGWGIILARRVMDEAEPNQILCSDTFAEPLKYDVSELKYLGEREVKWGKKIRVFNYKTDKIGIGS